MKTMIQLMGLGALVLVTGCQSGDLDGLQWGDPNGGGVGAPGGAADGTNPASANNTPAATCSTLARKYKGFGGTALPSGSEPGAVQVWARDDAMAGVDRLRFKPYSALTGEFPRVTGVSAPALLGQSSTTFGTPAARWSTEPQASAVNLYTAFRVSFESCLSLTASDAKYAAAPADPTASTECAAMARKFWSRSATADEVKACVQVATVDSAQETVNGTTTNTDPRRRWAYACASVLSSAGFMTY